MGVEYYIVLTEGKMKKAAIFYLGRGYAVMWIHDIKEIQKYIQQLEDLLEDETLEYLDKLNIVNISIIQFVKLYKIYEILSEIDTYMWISLEKVLKVYYAYALCRDAWMTEGISCEIITEDELKERKEKLEEEGYDLTILD